MIRICSAFVAMSALAVAAPAMAMQGSQMPVDPGSAARVSLSSPDRDVAREAAELGMTSHALDDGLRGATIGAVHVLGAPDVARGQFAAAVAPFLGRAFGASDTQELLGAVSGVARKHGYVFATSRIPPQTVSAGVLTVEVLEGRIDEVRLEGEQRPEVADLLRPLVGNIGRTDDVDRLLMLATDLPGVTIGKAGYTLEGGHGILIVPVEYDRIRGWATIDNRGSKALGPVRTQLGVDIAALLSMDDRLTLQSVVTPADPGELSVFYARYAYLLPGASTELSLSGTYGRTNSGGRWEANKPHGQSIGGTASLTHAIARGRAESLWTSVDFTYFEIDQSWEDQQIQRDRVAALALSLNGYTSFVGGRLRAGASATLALPVFGATRQGDPLASRRGAGSDYLVLRAWTNWTGKLAGPFSARFGVTTQFSSEPVLAIDQLTIGGQGFGRGYDFSERAGDEGALASAEFRSDLIDRGQGLLRWLQIYTFADGGVVRNLRSPSGTGDLYSAGAGTRLRLGSKIRVEVEAAFPLNYLRYDSGDKAPQIMAALGAQF